MRGLLVGRFQPFHRGHWKVVETIRRERPAAALLLAIGSAEESFTWKNPFTAGERFEMIDRTLGGADGPRVHLVPVADIRRHAQWVRYLESLLPSFDRVYTNNPLTRLLFERAGYAVETPPIYSRPKYEGEHIRRCLALNRGWRPLVSPPVAAYLTEIEAPHRLAMLRERSGLSSPSATA
ncbi:MAG TPA: nicotinamide-nucleotide adenylyltransferase [Thermoplasmata archaeon]|nr:nicotinamide-nucleotide adenylyltransferase [Thermoplasmata archaeon]